MVAAPEMIRVRRRCDRSETAAWRASMDPAATSGRNGWYVMYGRGSMITSSASLGLSRFSSFHAV